MLMIDICLKWPYATGIYIFFYPFFLTSIPSFSLPSSVFQTAAHSAATHLEESVIRPLPPA